MATKINNNDPYPATPDRIMEMQKDEQYWVDKYKYLGALEVTIHSIGQEGDAWVVKSTREIPAQLPGFAKKVIGDKTIITQTEKWSPDGEGGYNVDWLCDIKNAPGTFDGWMHIVPARDGEADWILEFTINAGIPMVGKKLEGVVVDQTKEQLVGEFAFNKQWLSEHA